MSKEIVDAVKALEQEKGISADKLMDALEDALLSAYKKTPGAAKYARVDLDHETGDFRVFELILPPELEEKLLAEAGFASGMNVELFVPGQSPPLERLATAFRDVAKQVGVSRVTAWRYLERLADEGTLTRQTDYGKAGRPKTRYTWR